MQSGWSSCGKRERDRDRDREREGGRDRERERERERERAAKQDDPRKHQKKEGEKM